VVEHGEVFIRRDSLPQQLVRSERGTSAVSLSTVCCGPLGLHHVVHGGPTNPNGAIFGAGFLPKKMSGISLQKKKR